MMSQLLSVAFLDVFHGDCIVLTFDEQNRKACIVIDGGETEEAAKRLAVFLKNENVESIDLLIATHIDEDHIMGLNHLLGKMSNRQNSWNKGKVRCCQHYWGPKPDPNWDRSKMLSPLGGKYQDYLKRPVMNYIIQSVGQNQDLNILVEKFISQSENIHYPSLQDKPPLNLFQNISLDLLAPDVQIVDSQIQKKAMTITNAPYQQQWLNAPSQRQTGRMTLKDLQQILAFNAEAMAGIANRTANNQSIVVRIAPRSPRAKRWSFLFSGDAELDSWNMMLQHVETKKKLSSAVLKVPHHGSENGISPSFFKKIDPEDCIISVGQKHGLPNRATLNLIKSKKNVRLFCSERNINVKDPGPCLNAKECIRKTAADFRSLRYIINMETGDSNLEVFIIKTELNRIEIQKENIWCPVMRW